MNPSPTPPAPAPETEHHRRVLNDLIEMGANIAKTLHDQITAPTTANDPHPTNRPEAALAFDRVARAVRRTILLAQKLAEPPKPPAPAPSREAARKQILRSIEDSIHESATPAQAQPLRAELQERLDRPDLAEHLDKELSHRPIAHIIEDIRRDLGLAEHYSPRGWKRRRPADIAVLNARAATPPRPTPPPQGATQPSGPAHPHGP